MAFTTIQGSGANDATTFVGTSGVDAILIQNVANPVRLTGLAANDVITIQSNLGTVSGYTLLGGDGDDNFTASSTNLVSSFLNGNAGNDVFSLVGASQSTVFGGQGNDGITFAGTIYNTRVNGNAGIDAITTNGGAFSSSVFGGQGADAIILAGQTSSSVVQGDDGNDSIGGANGVTGSVVSSTINGNAGQDVITIGAITAFSNSTVYGGAGEDTITAATAGVAVVLSGDDANDNITGSAFADTILGGAGNDTITGGLLADNLTGGAGVNTFRYVATDFGATVAAVQATVVAGTMDTITDFKNTGALTTTDFIGGVFSTTAFTNNASVLAGGYATYALALAAAEGSADGATFLAAVGTGTSYTAFLFQNTTLASATDVTAVVQLGTTGQFGTAALANAAIVQTQIVA